MHTHILPKASILEKIRHHNPEAPENIFLRAEEVMAISHKSIYQKHAKLNPELILLSFAKSFTESANQHLPKDDSKNMQRSFTITGDCLRIAIREYLLAHRFEISLSDEERDSMEISKDSPVKNLEGTKPTAGSMPPLFVSARGLVL